MLNLLKYQFRKLFRNVVFYIIIGLVLIQNVISIFDFTGKDAYFVDYILRFDQYNLIMFGAAVFVPLFACGDYANGAVKTVFGKGYTRTQNFISKLIACLAANIMICGLQIGLMLILGASVIPNSGFTPKLAGEAAYMLFLFAFCECGFTCVFFGVSEVVGNPIIAVVVNFFGMFLLTAILIGLSMAVSYDLSQWMLEAALTDLGTLPMTNKVVLKAWTFPVVYSAVFLGLGYLFALRREVK